MREQLRKAFLEYDTDGDGYLNQDESAELFSAYAERYTKYYKHRLQCRETPTLKVPAFMYENIDAQYKNYLESKQELNLVAHIVVSSQPAGLSEADAISALTFFEPRNKHFLEALGFSPP